MFAESSKEQFASTTIAEELVLLFQKQSEHEKKEMIFEVLAPLAENGMYLNFNVVLVSILCKGTMTTAIFPYVPTCHALQES